MKYIQFKYLLEDLEKANKIFLNESRIHFIENGVTIISTIRLNLNDKKEVEDILIKNDLSGDVDEYTIRINI